PHRRSGPFPTRRSSDLWLVAGLKVRFPESPLHAVGFSLGGSMLIRYLAEAGAGAGFTSCAAVSVTFDLDDTATRACRGFNRVYQDRKSTRLNSSHVKIS